MADGTPSAQALAIELRNMSFEQFHTRYVNGARPGENLPFGSGQLGTGHVALLEIDDAGHQYVIEAMPARGVQRITYADWHLGRTCETIWHGRLDRLPANECSRIVSEAVQHVGRPYDFWNLKLDDASAFYCSKLVWLAVRNATGVALDGDPDTGPRFWVSPKRLLLASSVVKLHNPDDSRGG
jgi:uncharacterized protein YycO